MKKLLLIGIILLSVCNNGDDRDCKNGEGCARVLHTTLATSAELSAISSAGLQVGDLIVWSKLNATQKAAFLSFTFDDGAKLDTTEIYLIDY